MEVGGTQDRPYELDGDMDQAASRLFENVYSPVLGTHGHDPTVQVKSLNMVKTGVASFRGADTLDLRCGFCQVLSALR